MPVVSLFFAILNEIGTHYRVRLALLLAASVFAGLMEITGVALIFPLIKLVSNPRVVESNAYFNWIYTTLHFTDPRHMIYFIAGVIGLVFIFKNMYMLLFQRAQLRFIKSWRDELCARIMDRYLAVPYLFHVRRSSGGMINTLNFTAYYVLNIFMMSFIMLCSHVVVAFILLGFVMVSFPVASLVAGAMLAVFTVLQVVLIRKRSMRIASLANEARAQNLMVITQAIGAVKETKSFTREGYFSAMHRHSNAQLSDFDRQALFLNIAPTYLTEIVLVFTIIVMAVLVLSQIYSPVHGITNLAILAAVAFRLAPMVNRGLYSYSQVRVSSQAASEFLAEVKLLDKQHLEDISVRPAPLSFHKQLSLQKAGFNYKKGLPALSDVTLSIKKGQFVGIVGVSGAGKTTLVDIILGLLQPTSGKYYVDDTLITGRNARALRGIIGYVSQSPCLFNATLRQNVAFGVKPEEIDDARVEAALKMARIHDFFARKKDGIRSWINDDGKNLSGGQRQRVAIARALYGNPQIIVLDEATSALDVETEHEITQVINSLKGERTIIAIAHRLSTLRECDHVIYMDSGRIVDIGTFTELNRRHKNFSRLLELSAVQ